MNKLEYKIIINKLISWISYHLTVRYAHPEKHNPTCSATLHIRVYSIIASSSHRTDNSLKMVSWQIKWRENLHRQKWRLLHSLSSKPLHLFITRLQTAAVFPFQSFTHQLRSAVLVRRTIPAHSFNRLQNKYNPEKIKRPIWFILSTKLMTVSLTVLGYLGIKLFVDCIWLWPQLVEMVLNPGKACFHWRKLIL